MTSFDYIAAFYAEHHTPDGIVREIDSLLSAQPLNARAIPFGCELATLDWLDGRTSGERKAQILYKDGRLSCFQLNYSFKHQGRQKKKSGRFYTLQDEQYQNVFVALTIEPTDFYHRALLPFLSSLYPKVMMTFITHKKLRRLLEQFQSKGNYSALVITRASQRLRYEERERGHHTIPVVSWPSITLGEAFDWVYEQNGWFESISFDVRQRFLTLANITLTRKGIIRANALFADAYKSFLKPVSKTIHDNLELFSHRSRLEREDRSPRPLVIDFEAGQFRDVEENGRFIQAMRRLKTASVSVLHGNPYIQLSVIDYFDGSVFDVWVLDEHQIVIVPQLKGSVAAIKRLINHVFDDYAEGQLSNYSADRV
ncbi:MAG: hypothetical protein ACR2H4_00575 [Pyrinomonadaceae bacterium]